MKCLKVCLIIGFLFCLPYIGRAEESFSTAQKAEEAARLFIKNQQYPQAMKTVDEGLNAFPKDYQLHMTKAELYEQKNELIEAMKVYKHVLELYPGNQGAINLKLRSLMDMGANTISLEKMNAEPKVDAILVQRARGNIAMNYIRWEEPLKAIDMIKDKELKSAADYKKAADNNVPADPKLIEKDKLRNRWDKLLALHAANQFADVLKQYEVALADGLDVPSWAEEAAADSYLYFRQPKKALDIYGKLLKKNPESFKTQMAYYYTLVDLGRYKEAQKILDKLEAKLPSRIKERGILSDNWNKAEVAYNQVWVLIYQDRLKDAQNKLEKYFTEAPANTTLRGSLAHLYAFRGWPRKAQTEFEILQTLDPTSVSNANGYARNLYDNTHKKEGRELINRLYRENPYNRHVARTKRLIEVDDMGLLTIDAYYSEDHPGEDEFWLSLRGDQPISEHNTLFAEIIRRETTQFGKDDVTNRFYLGDIYRPDNLWKIMGALTGDSRTGDNFGFLGEVTMTPGDYWTHSLGYDSRTIDVPLRSRAAGVDVQSYSYETIYRHSELFNTSAGVNFKDFDDGNENFNYAWRTDTALTNGAYWRTRLGTELSYSTYSKQDVDYFAPENIYTFYLVPNIEHVWFRRYEKALVDRFFVGLGQQWQKGFDRENVGYLRYEVDYRHSDTFGFLVGTIYSLRNYDGNDVNNLNVYTTIRKRF